ncbi:MAG: hypothetical protein CO182_08210, partial [Lysobacterales bacterium CG_4_9_14_3_um_filter_62_6]
MRVQRTQQTADRRSHQLLVVDRFDIGLADAAEYRHKRAQILIADGNLRGDRRVRNGCRRATGSGRGNREQAPQKQNATHGLKHPLDRPKAPPWRFADDTLALASSTSPRRAGSVPRVPGIGAAL